MELDRIIKKLRSMGSKKIKASLARFGINTGSSLGVSIPKLRALAKQIKPDHSLALKLWDTEIHEARILAGMVDEKEKVTEKQMDAWVRDFSSWDVCDQVCDNLFSRTVFAVKKTFEWADGSEEFVRRAGFTMMAVLAWFRMGINDRDVARMLSAIKKHACDPRNFVKKAVNWALRNIGKSGTRYHKQALALAKELSVSNDRTARWIGLDAFRELSKEKIIKRAGIREESFSRRSL
jgi:3-methyladenine DNA glycosylase AlkD